MKNYTILLTAILLLSMASTCHKDEILDYRDAFTGNYNCHKLSTFWTIEMDQPDTTFNGDINVLVTKVPSTSNLIVVQNDTIPIDSAGHYFGFYEPPSYNNYELNFRNDSIFIHYYYGGLGGGTTCDIEGGK